jgi:hypothetical protein
MVSKETKNYLVIFLEPANATDGSLETKVLDEISLKPMAYALLRPMEFCKEIYLNSISPMLLVSTESSDCIF